MAASPRLSAECQRLLEQLRKHCPGALPADPLPAGSVADAVQIDARAAAQLTRTAALVAAGIDDLTKDDAAQGVLWRQGGHALLVFPAKVGLRLGDGVMALAIPVYCDQSDNALVHVTFVVGDPKRPAGLVAATEERPRGPAAVIDVWGDNLVAYAWRTVLELAAHLAGEAGRDVDGSRLVPIALSVTADALAVVPMARHTFDRTKA